MKRVLIPAAAAIASAGMLCLAAPANAATTDPAPAPVASSTGSTPTGPVMQAAGIVWGW